MAFLNPPDVLPEAMRFLIRGLLWSGGTMSEDELVRMVAPEGLVEALSEGLPAPGEDPVRFKAGGRIIASASLAAMRGAGLVVQDRGGDPTLASVITDRFDSWTRVTPAKFAQMIRETALASVSGEIDDELAAGADDLVNALALLLSMPDPLGGIQSFESGAGKTMFDYQKANFGSDNTAWIVRNRERYASLVRWATYLGVARVLGGGLVVDPSAALEAMALPLLDGEVTIAEFLDRLAPVMPYSDCGVIGTSVRRRVGAPSGEISPGLTQGLLTLHHQERITLLDRSDAETLGFRIDPEHVVPFSHVAPGAAS